MSETDDITRKTGWAIRELSALWHPVSMEQRAEDAYGVAVRLFELIRRVIPDNENEDSKRLMAAWFKSVRDSDFRKFKKALRKYENKKSKIEEE